MCFFYTSLLPIYASQDVLNVLVAPCLFLVGGFFYSSFFVNFVEFAKLGVVHQLNSFSLGAS